MGQHIIENIGHKVTSHGDQGHKVALTGRLALTNSLVHLLVAGHIADQKGGQIDSGITGIGRTLLGNVLGVVQGGAGDVFGGGQAQEAGQVSAGGKTRDIGQLTDQSQGVADPGARDAFDQRGFGTLFDQAIAQFEEMLLLLAESVQVIEQVMDSPAEDLAPDGASDDVLALGQQVLDIG